MKKKSIWQEILDRGIWVLIFLIGLVLSTSLNFICPFIR